ncbi:MAG: Gfo/Idh/MocA family protein [Planctomycetota bacterium]
MARGRTRPLSRRRFLKRSAAAGAGVLFLPTGKVLGANNEVRVAIIGTGGMGGGHMGHFNGRHGAKVVAVSDPDKKRMDEKTRKIKHKIAKHQDFRKILDMKDVDAVVIATPNHWHAPAAILACQAGKDVYVQKPVAHCIWESRQMVKAARKYKRIVQAGTQQRSDPYYGKLRADLKSGKYGEIKLVHCLKHNVRGSIGKVSGPQSVPDHIDYDLWCGPAPKTPVMRRKLHYDWHWQWNWGDGEMGNWGPHVVDDLRNILDWDDVPGSVIGAGGRFAWNDDGQTPNMHIALFERKGFKVVVDVRDLPAKKGTRGAMSYMRSRGHNVIVCEGGTIRCGRGGGAAYDKDGKRIKKYSGDAGRNHTRNFIDAVRSRKPGDLNAEIEVGHQSTMMCLLANIAFRVGKEAGADRARQAMKDHKDALDTIESMVKQIKANGDDPNRMMLGPKLTFDPKAEKFVGANAAEGNRLLRYEMRKGFAVPEKV